MRHEPVRQTGPIWSGEGHLTQRHGTCYRRDGAKKINSWESFTRGYYMKNLLAALCVASMLATLCGCSVYRIQAKDKAEGTTWIARGNNVWHCTAAGGQPVCKKVLDDDSIEGMVRSAAE